MSWVLEEWKEGLPTRTLQKIQELEGQLEKLKKERQQRQLQLEALEAVLQKQKQKAESEKSEVTALKRENQSLIELCDNQEKMRQKLSHEQQVKDTQISILEGQLSATKKHVEKMEQELKRYKNDLERSQQSFSAADMSVCVTPQKSVTVSFTPGKLHDSLYEELQEKYNKEVEERKKLEAELKILQIKLVNQTPQPAPQNAMNHRDIARHQLSSSVFSWQQERTPSRASSSSHDASLKRNYASIQYPWEQEETPSKRGLRSDAGNRSFCDSNNPANDQLRSQNQELRSRVNELDLQIQVQEKELKVQLSKLQETQALLDKTRGELAEKDKTLTKSRDDLAQMTVQLQQSVDKFTSAEQKLKKVSDELSCQRQNAESARRSLEQKLKEQEKESQQEMLRQQNSLKNTEEELKQMRSKQSQEAEQAKNQFNSCQSELERVAHKKKMLEQEVEELRQKLSRAEQAATTGQSHVTDLEKERDDLKKEREDLKKEREEARNQQNATKSQLDQKVTENAKLEDEVRRATQSLRQNEVFIEELRNKNTNLEADIKAAVQKLNCQDSSSLENLKATMSILEKERDLAKEVLLKRENDLTEAKNTQTKMSEELSSLKNQLHCKEQECNDSSYWKKEYDKITAGYLEEKQETSGSIKDLESAVQSLTGQITVLETDKKALHTQIKTLQDRIDGRTADLEVQKVNSANLCSQMASESQKYQKEVENLLQKISELEAKLETQEEDVRSNQAALLEVELETQKKLNAELQGRQDLLVRHQQETPKHKSEAEGKECLCNAPSRDDAGVGSVISVIREKEEEIRRLSEKLSCAKAEMECGHQKNQELRTKLQELALLSESWSAERETLAASITALQRDIEKLMEENKRMSERCNMQNYKEMQPRNAEIDPTERDNVTEVNPADGSREGNVIPKREGTEWKEKASRIEQEISGPLPAHEERSSLVGKLQGNEELQVKHKETISRGAEVKIESLNESCMEKDPSVDGVREHLIDLQSPPNDSLESVSPLRNDSQDAPESPKEKKGSILHSLDETMLMGGRDGLLMDSSLLDLTGEISMFTPAARLQNREENLTLLINMDHLTLTSSNDSTLPLPDLTQLNFPESPTLSPFMSPPVKERLDGNRKSITSEIVDLILQQSPQQQQVLSPDVRSNQPADVNDWLMVYHMEISRLQKQHFSEIATWQQKLKDQALEMETKLSAEKAEAQRLAQELEAARLELQILDTSARSLLSFNEEDLTTRFDGPNQTICSFLPIASLSLGNTELQSSGHLISPKVENKSISENIPEMVNHESPKEQEEGIVKSCQERKRRKGHSGAQADNLESQDVSKCLQLKTEEKEQLSQQEREEMNPNLVEEISALSAHVERLKAELLKHQEKQDLDNKLKDFEVERLELLEKIELMSIEKSQSANKVVELEKELNDSLNAAEMLKQQICELCKIQETLETSSKEWKESYLQIESELKRAKSERANMENHALSLEGDLDALQAKCQRLQEESQGNSRTLHEIQENLNAAVTEKLQLNQEMENLVEEKEELEQMYKKLKVREQDLESSKLSSRNQSQILEAELRTLKEKLQASQLTAEQLAAERDSMFGLQENEKVRIEELQNEIQKVQEEKKILVKDQEDLQTQVSTMQVEAERLSRALERCQSEKQELGSSLSSAQEEVTLMRTGIEKLKVKIEADEQKKRQTMEKLKESNWKFDKLNDRMESLERELLMSEENLENAILQSEMAKEEAETLKEQKEALEVELKCLKKKLEELEEELQSSREKMVELEATVAAITKSLENQEMKYTQLMDDSKKQQDLLQGELDELLTQKALSDQTCNTAVAECADMSSKMKRQREELLQELEKAQTASSGLEETLQKLTSEQEECKLQLNEKTRQLMAFESQAKEAEQREVKYSSEVSRWEVESENLKNRNKSLQAALEELEGKVQTASAENQTLQATIADLKTSCRDREAQMEATKSEREALLDKVAALEDACRGLQSKLQDADLRMKSAEEQNRRGLTAQDEEMEAIRRRSEERSAQLLSATSEAADLRTSLASLRADLQSQAQKHKNDVAGYEERLRCADLRHRSLLDEIRERDADLGSHQERMAALQTLLNAREQEMESLRAANGELKESLCKAEEQLEVMIIDLKKANSKAGSDLRRWMTSCEELEEEKQQLQRRILQQEETLKHSATDLNTSGDISLSEMEELRQCLEEKTLEAEESVEKYCNLLVKTHKLEEANEALSRQVDLMRARLKELGAKKDVAEPRGSEEAKKGKRRRSAQRKQAGKRRRESENAGQNPSTPLADPKRVRKDGSHGVEEECEPDGLPEVVKKGFADIPSGKQSPCVLRRAAVPLRRSPRFPLQTDSPSVLNARIDSLDNIPDLSSPTPGGSKSQATKATEGAAAMDVLSPLAASVRRKSRASDNLCATKPEKRRASAKASHDDTEEEGTCHVQ
ncbi:centromere protein F isoform X2 [Eleutherodactylus coqui]|uniref:centromere protein F isoform X2 n=1 Tax=Eleutherodactylus coqui TaxID=57060 RepID=UPI003461CAB5